MMKMKVHYAPVTSNAASEQTRVDLSGERGAKTTPEQVKEESFIEIVPDKNLPPVSQSLKGLETHNKMKSFQETDKKHVKGQQVPRAVGIRVQAQKGLAERSRGVIVEKVRARD